MTTVAEDVDTAPLISSGMIPFAAVPFDVIEDQAISGDAFRLYAVLLSNVRFADIRDHRSGTVNVGYQRILEPLGWSDDKCGRVMTQLIKAGWIHRRRRIGLPSLTFVCATKGQRPRWPDGRSEPAAANRTSSGYRDRTSPGTVTEEPGGRKELEGTTKKTPPTPGGVQGTNGSKPKWSEPARAVATAAWDRFAAEERTPNASSWKAVAQVAQQLLDVGHDATAVTDAIVRARVCTFNAVMLELGSRSTDTGEPAKPAPAPPPPKPARCATCIDTPGWVEHDTLRTEDDEHPLSIPCPDCRPDQHARWVGAPPVLPEDTLPLEPARRRDLE